MTNYCVNREVIIRAESTFFIDVPHDVEKAGKAAIKAYIKDNHDWRDDMHVDEDIISIERDQ